MTYPGNPIANENNIFDAIFKQLLKNEGIYSDHPADKGGKTIFGITKRYHPEMFDKVYNLWKSGQVEEALNIAKEFYKKNYWDSSFNHIPDTALQFKLFDLSVNLGKTIAIKLLKRVMLQKFDLPVTDNNHLDITTLLLLSRVYKAGLGDEFYFEFIKEVEKHYRRLRGFPTFGKGWLKRLYFKFLFNSK